MNEGIWKGAQSRGPRRGLRRIAMIAGIAGALIVIALVAGYLYVGTGHFVRHIVFPIAGRQIKGDITAGEIAFSPLSEVTLKNVKVMSKDAPQGPPLFACESLEVQYHGLSFLTGTPRIERARLSQPQATLTLRAGEPPVATSAAAGRGGAGKGGVEKSGAATLPSFSIGDLKITGAQLRVVEVDAKTSTARSINLRDCDFSVTGLEPGKEAPIAFEAAIRAKDPKSHTDVTGGKITMESRVKLGRDLSHCGLEGKLSVSQLQGTFHNQSLRGYGAEGTVNLKQEGDRLDLNPLSIVFSKNKESGGSVAGAGWLDAKKGEGEFNLKVKDVNRVFLNLAGSYGGDIDFCNTTANVDYTVKIKEHKKKIEVDGAVDVKAFSVLAPEVSKTPTEEIDLAIKNSVRYDAAASTLEVATFSLSALQQGKETLSGRLAQPLRIDLSGKGSAGAPQPDINCTLAVKDLDLAPYAVLAPLPAGARLDSGRLGADLNILFRNNGRDLEAKGGVKIAGLAGSVAGRAFPKMDISIDEASSVKDLKQVRTEGQVDLLLDSRAAAQLGVPQTPIRLDHALAYAAGDLNIERLDVSLVADKGQGGGQQAAVTVKGKANFAQGQGKLQIAASDLDQRLLAPLAAPFLRGLRLQSVRINANKNVEFGNHFMDLASEGSATAADLHIVDVASGRDVVPSLTLKVDHELSMKAGEGTFKKLAVTFQSKGQEAESIALSGTFALPKSGGAGAKQAAQASLKAQSSRLTLDRYLPPAAPAAPAPEVASSDRKRAAKGRSAESASEAATAESEPKEPAPLDLNFVKIDGDVSIGELAYREITATDIAVNASLANSVLDCRKFAMKLTGGEINATARAEFNAPQWKYSVKGSANKVALAALANSFAPRLKDNISGDAFAEIDLSGQGITTPNLRKSLAGTVKGQLRDGELRNIPLLDALATATEMPELSSLQFIECNLDAGVANGTVKLKQMDFKGTLEKLGVTGKVGFDSAVDLAFTVAVAGPWAERIKKIKYVGKALEQKDGFVEIPMPVGMKGTLTHPEPSFDKTRVLEETGKKVLKDLFEDRLLKALDKQSKKPDKHTDKQPAKQSSPQSAKRKGP